MLFFLNFRNQFGLGQRKSISFQIRVIYEPQFPAEEKKHPLENAIKRNTGEDRIKKLLLGVVVVDVAG